MLKVLIAEKDEEHQMRILGLVNWGVYGFETMGTCSDGITAMEEIFRMPPDLVFTNDDLPRLNGIELIEHIQGHGILCDFVIVSANESFEVARKAMRLGVEEYLLKPVGREEIIRVLKKYANRRRSVNQQDFNERFFQTRRLLRNAFMDSFTALKAPEHHSIEYMNQKYHFKFHEGIFQSAIIVVTGISGEENAEFLGSVIEDVRAIFDPVCYEMIPYVQGHFRVSFIFNYGEDSGAGDMLPQLFTIVKERLQKCNYEKAVFCAGIGLPEYDTIKLRRTLETAERAVRCGILRGQNKLYIYGGMEFDKLTSFDILTPTLVSDLKSSAEALDIKGFERTVRSAFSPVSFKTDPAVLIDICWAAVEAVVEVFETEDDTSGLRERKEILDNLGSISTLPDTITGLVSWARQLFSRRIKEREYVRPVREAMRFIEANCTQPLTLERVAERVHLNASYFCTIFKKETGQNFSDYLTSCRIKEAKRLLRESSLNVAQICSAVGYTDNKHFSQTFTKSVGIKPSAYRALHG